MIEPQKKSLNLKAKSFTPSIDIDIPITYIPLKQKKNTKNIPISQELKDEFTIPKNNTHNLQIKEFIQKQDKAPKEQKSKVVKVKEQKAAVQFKEKGINDIKEKKVESDELLTFDPKFGYWHYMHEDYLKLLKQQKEMKIKEDESKQQEIEKQKQDESAIEQKKINRIQKIKQRQMRFENRLKLKRIGTIVYNLRVSRGILKNKPIKISKPKKPSKIKLTQMKYKQDYDGQLSRVLEQINMDSQVKEDKEEKKVEEVKKDKEEEDKEDKEVEEDEDEDKDKDKENEQESNEEAECNEIEVSVPNVAAIVMQIQINNPYAQRTYNMMKVRGWVVHILSKDMDDIALKLINAISLAQASKKILDPKKFKKRIVAGFNEVIRTLTTILDTKLSQLVILPINLIENPLPNGTDSKVLKIICLCLEKNIPFVNVSNRKKLGLAFRGKLGAKISAISIINYQGQNELFQELMDQHKKQLILYQQQYDFNLSLNLL